MESNEALIGRFLEAVERTDMAAIADLVADDFTMEWPQSGERFRGKQNALAAMEVQEVKPEPAGEPRMLNGGEFFVLMMPLRYGEEVHHYVGVFELRDGKIGRSTEYFGAPFPAPEFRAEFAERS